MCIRHKNTIVIIGFIQRIRLCTTRASIIIFYIPHKFIFCTYYYYYYCYYACIARASCTEIIWCIMFTACQSSGRTRAKTSNFSRIIIYLRLLKRFPSAAIHRRRLRFVSNKTHAEENRMYLHDVLVNIRYTVSFRRKMYRFCILFFLSFRGQLKVRDDDVRPFRYQPAPSCCFYFLMSFFYQSINNIVVLSPRCYYYNFFFYTIVNIYYDFILMEITSILSWRTMFFYANLFSLKNFFFSFILFTSKRIFQRDVESIPAIFFSFLFCSCLLV